MTAEELAENLNLIPHPEGGYYRETYRSAGTLEPSTLGNTFEGARNFSTSIYFLLVEGNFSAFHRIKQDEVWHFYLGDPITLHEISPDGDYSLIRIGPDIKNGEHPQYVVPKGHWFASEVETPGQYALAGCTVAPGFDFRDFEMAQAGDLISICPGQENLISRLTR